MALYTSYYTRQLALREAAGGGAAGDLQQEGEKTAQKSVARRTVDFTAPYITWFEVGAGLLRGREGGGAGSVSLGWAGR